jgi:hypothetical protein
MSDQQIEQEIDPHSLTSPGTVDDPALEERRAQEAAVREAESRKSTETKFEELRQQQEDERHEAARHIGELTDPNDSASES